MIEPYLEEGQCCNYLLQMKKNQQKIQMILDSKKIEYEKLDIAASEEYKETMRRLIGDPKALPPQLFNEDQYCGVSQCPVL